MPLKKFLGYPSDPILKEFFNECKAIISLEEITIKPTSGN